MTFTYARRAHRCQDGSPTIFGLTVMAGLILPLMAVLWMTAQVSNSSQAAQGIAYSVSYGTMMRSVDLNATSSSDSPGGIILRQDDPYVYQDARDAVAKAAEVANTGMSGTSIRLIPQPDAAPYREASSPLGGQPDVGIVNVPTRPEDNRSYVGQLTGTCSGGMVANPFMANEYPACWTDIRAQDWKSDAYTKDPVGSNGMRSSAWDHYTSGAEAQVGYSMDLWMFGKFDGTRRGVSSFGRPCVEGETNCSQ